MLPDRTTYQSTVTKTFPDFTSFRQLSRNNRPLLTTRRSNADLRLVDFATPFEIVCAYPIRSMSQSESEVAV